MIQLQQEGCAKSESADNQLDFRTAYERGVRLRYNGCSELKRIYGGVAIHCWHRNSIDNYQSHNYGQYKADRILGSG